MYVFENKHELPLFCYCCGEPLACEDLSKYKKGVIGRKLEAMLWDTEKLDDGREVIDFGLELSMREGEDEPPIVSTSLLSAEMLIHPENCGYRDRETRVRKSSKKRRSRGRRGRKSA
jgi:hypothetical protein